MRKRIRKNKKIKKKAALLRREGGLSATTRRAPETLQRPSVLALTQQEWAACFFLRASWRIGGVGGKEGVVGSKKQGCILNPREKIDRPKPVAFLCPFFFSLAPLATVRQFQSNARRRCANPQTGERQSPASRGPNSRE